MRSARFSFGLLGIILALHDLSAKLVHLRQELVFKGLSLYALSRLVQRLVVRDAQEEGHESRHVGRTVNGLPSAG